MALVILREMPFSMRCAVTLTILPAAQVRPVVTSASPALPMRPFFLAMLCSCSFVDSLMALDVLANHYTIPVGPGAMGEVVLLTPVGDPRRYT
jgi:hypothetical protein